MKTLILTSSAYLVLDQIVENLPKSPKDSTLAFIPTASDVYAEKPWVDADRDQLIARGFQLRACRVCSRRIYLYASGAHPSSRWCCNQ